MSAAKSNLWILSDDWAVATDPYCWILYAWKGNQWRATSFYPTPQVLLKHLHEKLLRLTPHETDLIEHVSRAQRAAEACASAFSEHLNAKLGVQTNLTSARAYITLQQGENANAS